MRRVHVVLGLVLLASGAAGAQSMPSIMKPKAAAQKAAAATDAHTAAMTAEPKTDAEQAAGRKGASPDSAKTPAGAIATQSSAGTTAVTPARADTGFQRESYAYQSGGRRDPFVSLMSTGELRPLVTDLRIVGILLDADSRSSVAMLRDVSTQDRYRVKVGMTLGRMRVARIDQKSVTFTIEEFGFSRQETLTVVDPKKEKGK